MTGQIQDRNSQMVDNLRADLQPRYEPNFAWKGITGLYQALPALRGFWPCSAQINATQATYLTDIANNFHCRAVGGVMWGYDDLIPYILSEDCVCWYADNAQFDITGTEPSVVAAERGVSLGCWIKPDTNNTNYSLISKYHAAANLSYLLELVAGVPQFVVSTNGAATVTVTHTTPVTTGIWQYVSAQYWPSARMRVSLDDNSSVLVAGVPASIFNGDAQFRIGASHAGSENHYRGLFSCIYICASALSTSIDTAIWQQTRAMFRR